MGWPGTCMLQATSSPLHLALDPCLPRGQETILTLLINLYTSYIPGTTFLDIKNPLSSLKQPDREFLTLC